jgi:hypothetical protein
MFRKVTIVYSKKETSTEVPSVDVIPSYATLNHVEHVFTTPEDCRKRQGGLCQAMICSVW